MRIITIDFCFDLRSIIRRNIGMVCDVLAYMEVVFANTLQISFVNIFVYPLIPAFFYKQVISIDRYRKSN